MPSSSIRTLTRSINSTVRRPRQHSHAFHSTTMSSAPAPKIKFSISTPQNPTPVPADVKEKTHHRKDGKGFQNPWPSFQDRLPSEFMRWMIVDGLTGKRKKVDLTPPTVNVRAPSFLPSRETPKLRATWLGHACYFVEFPGGLRVLFDPVFEDRCSPLSFLGPKRYTKAPCQVDGLPEALDVLVLSHNHYDHLSFPTVKAIVERYPEIRIFVPLGVKAWFEKNLGAAVAQNVTELDWWEEREVTLSFPGTEAEKLDITATFSCLPAQHMTARNSMDRFQTLWASWAISSGGKSLYFTGDSAYRTVTKEAAASDDDYGPEFADLPTCPAFKQIGSAYNAFDLALIPIGAYAPRYLMSPVHCNPYDAVNIFVDIKAKRALGMHFGVWVLTEEPVLEPPRLLKQALLSKGLKDDDFEVCEIGESREY